MEALTAVYKAELWTKVINGENSWDMWAVIMPNGLACAFGKQSAMEAYADKLNNKQGE